MDNTTQKLSNYIKEKGITVAAISKATGISYGKLDPSLKTGGKRELRAGEFLAICDFIGKSPLEFRETQDTA